MLPQLPSILDGTPNRLALLRCLLPHIDQQSLSLKVLDSRGALRIARIMRICAGMPQTFLEAERYGGIVSPFNLLSGNCRRRVPRKEEDGLPSYLEIFRKGGQYDTLYAEAAKCDCPGQNQFDLFYDDNKPLPDPGNCLPGAGAICPVISRCIDKWPICKIFRDLIKRYLFLRRQRFADRMAKPITPGNSGNSG